jgi:hypothetical protein
MTRAARETLRRAVAAGRLRRRAAGEAGQALPEYVAVLGLVLLVSVLVLAAASPVGADVSRQLLCAVDPIVKEEGESGCEGDGGSGEDEEGDGEDGGEGDGYSPPTGSCEDDTTFQMVEKDDSQWDTAVVQIDCEWYPGPTICFSAHMPSGHLDRDRDDRVYREHEIQDFVDCVLDGRGDPSDDPDDPSCVNTMPTSGQIDADVPPNVQVGCRDWPVPKGCEGEWDRYVDAAAGKERAARSGELANCITERYTTMELPCVVEATGHVDETKMQFLFFRFGENDGTLIEKLGDGRIRVHILKGVEVGAGASGSDVGGTPVAFDIAGITGYSEDYTYEFTDMEAAQRWIDWYKRYSMTTELVQVGAKPNCPMPGRGVCMPQPDHFPDVGDVQELMDEEPEHHVLADATSDIKKVKLKGGLKHGAGVGQFELKGTVEGGYEGEVQVEDRAWSDGSRSATYTSADIGGFLIGAELGGKKPFTKDKKNGNTDGKGKGKGQVGKEWKGTTSTSVYWDKEGELSRLVIAMDEQVMSTLYKAGIDLEVVLPYGFKAGGGYKAQGEDGKISKVEMIIDFNQYPELRDELGPVIDEVFPRHDDGTLKKGDVEIAGNDEDGGTLYDAAAEYANVRELEYDASRVTEGGETGLKWQGLDLFKVEWNSIDDERTLKESSFEVTDVAGGKQKVSPAPQCRAKAFDPPDDYYTDEFSAPPTPIFRGGQSYDNP